MLLPYKSSCRITTLFGKKGNWKCGWHIGIDLVCMEDKTILAIASGVVELVSSLGDYGNHIRIKQDNGYISLYAHLSKILVNTGQKVTAGQPIGIEGSTGNSSGSHLHLEIHRGSYKYPAKDTSPEICPWLIDPCRAMGIEAKLGEVRKLPEFKTTEEVLAHWQKEGVIDSPDYWRKALAVVKNLDKLLLKVANKYK